MNPFWIWRNELNSLWTWLERIEPLFEYDSKNWISFWVWLKKSNFFFFWIRLNESNPFFWMWLKKIEILVEKIVKKFKMFFYMTRRIGPAFFNMTQRIEPFSIWLKDLIFIQCDPKNWTFFWLGLTELDPFSWIWLRELNFSWFFSCLQELNFFSKMTQRIEPFFFEFDAKNLNPFPIWLKELDPFLNMTRRIQHFFTMTRKNWTFLLLKYDSNTWTFVWVWLKEVNLLYEFQSKNWTFFCEYDSKKWVFFFFLHMTQRSELFWTLLKESNPFFKYDAKNYWTFF